MSSLSFQIRASEGCKEQPILVWDTVWDELTGYGDWAYAPASEAYNNGGLQAEAALQSAVILCLFTDRRCPEGHPLSYLVENDDPRGWWGDAVDVRADMGEAPMGSLLWLLARAQATPDIALWAQTFALEALAPLIGQQAVARVDAQAVLVAPSRINLFVQLYGRDGQSVYARRFDDLWREAISGPFWTGGDGGPGFSDGFISNGFG
jgi:phage gp46-like protein